MEIVDQKERVVSHVIGLIIKIIYRGVITSIIYRDMGG